MESQNKEGVQNQSKFLHKEYLAAVKNLINNLKGRTRDFQRHLNYSFETKRLCVQYLRKKDIPENVIAIKDHGKPTAMHGQMNNLRNTWKTMSLSLYAQPVECGT